jgi:crotonobetainyl-CoA:carnitine CoA-transferase CaiB-like acyl-CoA transferase
MLGPYRVLDLTDERGLLCGQVLSDLGADVIAVEPPGGSHARGVGPFAGDAADPERSLTWWGYARGKRSVALDLRSSDGRDELLRLAATADFLIESSEPGSMAALGIGYDDVAAVNPAIVYVSITPFGQGGPKSRYAATELTVVAAGGLLAIQGDDDRPPVRGSVPQGWCHAGAEAAAAALIAHHERVRSGCGQHVDVSAQQAVMLTTFASALAPPLGSKPARRYGGGVRGGTGVTRYVYPAKDGHVSLTLLFGSAIGPATQRLMTYVCEEGFCDEATRDKDWIDYPRLLATGAEPQSEYMRVKACVEAMTSSKTKAELMQVAMARNLLIAPVAAIDEVVASPQLAARGYWREVEQPQIGRAVEMPGPFVQASAKPIEYRRRAPMIGEHTAEIAAERRSPFAYGTGAGAGTDALPLDGVKILDFMWVKAGPASTRVLADYGATVVRVESSLRIDAARTLQPMHRGSIGPEHSGMYGNTNAGKLGMVLDLTTEAGREIVRDLVRWADVAAESFSPKAMRAWGLEYTALREINPSIIMLSTCLMGQTGPMSMFAGYGNLAAAQAGFYGVTGWPDRPPAGPYGAYTDTVSPRFTSAAILAALDYRRRTGEGQYIDQSQIEAALHFLTPAMLDYTVNGRVQTRVGNRDPQMAPHGVYPAAGDDAWIAIAVTDDECWRALCGTIGRGGLASDARYATLAARLERQDELDAIVGAWTRERDMYAAEEALQAAGVAASAVQNGNELWADKQLWHRGHFVELEHELHTKTWVEGSRFRLSRTPARIERTAPMLGRDNFYVMEQILGYDTDRIADIAASGVLR